MAIEKERRFLVNKEKFSEFKNDNPGYFYGQLNINQMYLVDAEDHSMRIRIITPSYGLPYAKIAYKGYISADTKQEFEFDIDLNQATNIYLKKKYFSIINKVRNHIKGWDIDSYQNGLIVAEFEFDDDHPFPKELPYWIDKEVTGVYEFTNVAMAELNTDNPSR